MPKNTYLYVRQSGNKALGCENHKSPLSKSVRRSVRLLPLFFASCCSTAVTVVASNESSTAMGEMQSSLERVRRRISSISTRQILQGPLLKRSDTTDFACRAYYFEEQYVNYLVARGVLPRACSQVGLQGAMALEVMREGNDKEKAWQGFDGCQDLLDTAVNHLQGSEELLKAVLDSNKKLMTNMNKIGERLLVVGCVIVFVLVLVLLVLLVK